MRVVVNESMKVFHGHVPVQLTAGQEIGGELAAMLLERAPKKVTAVEAGEGAVQALLDIEGTTADVLAWAGDDPARAAEALAAELGRDKPRSTLVKQLEKLAAAGEE